MLAVWFLSYFATFMIGANFMHAMTNYNTRRAVRKFLSDRKAAQLEATPDALATL